MPRLEHITSRSLKGTLWSAIGGGLLVASIWAATPAPAAADSISRGQRLFEDRRIPMDLVPRGAVKPGHGQNKPGHGHNQPGHGTPGHGTPGHAGGQVVPELDPNVGGAALAFLLGATVLMDRRRLMNRQRRPLVCAQ